MSKVVVINNLWQLCDLVDQVVADMGSAGYLYMESGDTISESLKLEDYMQLMEEAADAEEIDVFNFLRNTRLQTISFQEAAELSLNSIIHDYISEQDFKKVRGILRKDSRLIYGKIVSDSVSDTVLDQLIALRWKENLKLWCLRREGEKHGRY